MPPIETPVTIQGNGAHIRRAPGSPGFRLFRVSATGDLTLTDVTLTDGANDGGAIDNDGLATIVATTITHTVPYGGGSGIRNTGHLGVISSTIEYQRDFDGFGGGIVNTGYLVVSGSTLTGNLAAGGGALLNDGYAEVYDSTFTDNIGRFTGGAIRNIGELHVLRTSFVGNDGGNFGGAIRNSADLFVNDSYFDDNRVSIEGGAVENSASWARADRQLDLLPEHRHEPLLSVLRRRHRRCDLEPPRRPRRAFHLPGQQSRLGRECREPRGDPLRRGERPLRQRCPRATEASSTSAPHWCTRRQGPAPRPSSSATRS